jgi:hypothetical protein
MTFSLSEANVTLTGAKGAAAQTSGAPGDSGGGETLTLSGDQLDLLESSTNESSTNAPGALDLRCVLNGGAGGDGAMGSGPQYFWDSVNGGPGGAGGAGGSLSAAFQNNWLGSAATPFPYPFTFQLAETAGAGGAGGKGGSGSDGMVSGAGGAGGAGGAAVATVANIIGFSDSSIAIDLSSTGGPGGSGGAAGFLEYGGPANGGRGGAGGDATIGVDAISLSAANTIAIMASAHAGAGGAGGAGGVARLDQFGRDGAGGAGGDASVSLRNATISAAYVQLDLTADAGAGAAALPTYNPGASGAEGSDRIDVENTIVHVFGSSLSISDRLDLRFDETSGHGAIQNRLSAANGNFVFSDNQFIGSGASTLDLFVGGGGANVDLLNGRISIGGSDWNVLTGFTSVILDSNEMVETVAGANIYLGADADQIVVTAGHVGGVIYNATASNLKFDFQGFANFTEEQLLADTTVSGGDTLITIDGQTLTLVNYTGSLDPDFNYVACFLRGTRIATARGDVAIEALRIGDMARTAAGGFRPIIWIGRRRIDARRHPDPGGVWPVRVTAHAFGEGLPARDLWLSPGHNIAWEGALMPICALANARSIAHVECDEVEYWHVELDAHDVILSENLPSESYLDCGNRGAFANHDGAVELFADFAPRGDKQTCLPLVKEGPRVDSARAAARAALARNALSETERFLDGLCA